MISSHDIQQYSSVVLYEKKKVISIIIKLIIIIIITNKSYNACIVFYLINAVKEQFFSLQF